MPIRYVSHLSSHSSRNVGLLYCSLVPANLSLQCDSALWLLGLELQTQVFKSYVILLTRIHTRARAHTHLSFIHDDLLYLVTVI